MQKGTDMFAPETIDKIGDYSIYVSKRYAGTTTDLWQKLEGADIFSRIGLSYIAMLRFIPRSRYYGPSADLRVYDLPSAAALARTVIESYAVFFYLCVEPVCEEEAVFRKLLWLYHEEIERLEMLKFSNPQSSNIGKIQAKLIECKNRLEGCSWFLSLDEDLKRKAIDGKRARFEGNAATLGKAGISANYYQSIYKYLSNFVHTTAFSISQMVATRIENPEAFHAFDHVARLASGFMLFAVRDFKRLNGELQINNELISRALQLWEEIFKWEKLDYFNRP
jgi:hypothetical protein